MTYSSNLSNHFQWNRLQTTVHFTRKLNNPTTLQSSGKSWIIYKYGEKKGLLSFLPQKCRILNITIHRHILDELGVTIHRSSAGSIPCRTSGQDGNLNFSYNTCTTSYSQTVSDMTIHECYFHMVLKANRHTVSGMIVFVLFQVPSSVGRRGGGGSLISSSFPVNKM